MQNALIFGGGSKWGAEFVRLLSKKNYAVDLITGSDFTGNHVNTFKISWFDLNHNKIKEIIDSNKSYDLIFFNQNSGGAPNDHFLNPGNEIDINSWNYNFWLDCQLPYFVIHHLSKSINSETKIGWMLTGLITNQEKKLFQYSGYSGNKSFNLHILRGFSQFHQGIFFGINPWSLSAENYEKDSKNILSIIESIENKDNGKTFNKDGSYWI